MIIQTTQLNPKRRNKYRKNYTDYKRSRIPETVSPEIQAARESFEKFREYVCGHKTYPIQKGWEGHLNTGVDSKVLKGIAGQNTCILSWRGSTKSTYLIEWVAYQIGRHYSPPIGTLLKVLYVSFNLEVAMLKSEQLQNIISSDKFGEVFPHCRPDKNKWAHKVWAVDFAHANLTTTEEPYSLAACGITGSTASKRSHLIILDDIIPDPDAIANPQIREKMVRKWEAIIEPTLFDGGRAICLATHMRADSILVTTFVPPKWKVIQESALIIDENGEEISAWREYQHLPFAQSTQFLKEKRELSPVTFSFQYQNIIVRVETQSISPDLIQRGLLPNQLDALVMGVDLSAGLKQVNDYTTFVLGGVKWTGTLPHFYIIDAWEGRIMGNIEKLDAMIGLWNAWKHLLPQTKSLNANGDWEETTTSRLDIYAESNGYQLSLKGDYETYILGTKRLYDWRIIPTPSKGDKLERLRSVSGLFDNRLITFNTYGRLLGKTITQITQHGSTDRDDLADALEKCLSGLRNKKPIQTASY